MADFPAHLFRMDGDAGAVRASAGKWSAFGDAATRASAQILGLDTAQFVGPEGDLFREGLHAQMPQHLSVTGDAFGRVASALSAFAGVLEGLQERMRRLAARAPGLWEALRSAQGRVDAAADADAAHERAVAGRAESAGAPDTYRSDSGAASAALSAAQGEWDACVAAASGLRGELDAAVRDAVRVIETAKEMRFKENPKWWDLGGRFENVVRDNADLLARLSGALKVVSLVAGVLSFVPVLAPIMGPIALGTALVASAIDLSIYAATGQGSLRTILIDVGLNLLPGVGKLAQRGVGALRNSRVVARAASSTTATRALNAADEAAIADYTGTGYQAMNDMLRNPGAYSAAERAALQARADAVSTALAKLPPEPGTTYRGVDLSDDVLARYEPGNVVTERGFTSTDRTTAFPGNTFMTVTGQTGRDVAPFTMVPTEAEILYDQGTAFLVTGKTWDPDLGKWLITMTEVAP